MSNESAEIVQLIFLPVSRVPNPVIGIKFCNLENHDSSYKKMISISYLLMIMFESLKRDEHKNIWSLDAI